MRRPDPADLSRHPADGFVTRLYAELYCLGLAFIFHEGNNHIRKAITLLLFAVWSAVTVGLSFKGIATVQPPFYSAMTGLVFLIIGRMWDIEIQSFADLSQDDTED